jgi:hypothetical protein
MKKIIMSLTVFLLFIGNMDAQQLGAPTPLQQTMNAIPAIQIPLIGRSFKFEFGGNNWVAKVDGENFFAGIIEENGNILTLKTTHVWTGAIEDVINILERAGIPLGPAATPLRTAARLASRVAIWTPFRGSSIILDYNASNSIPLSFVSMERQETDNQTRERRTRNTGTANNVNNRVRYPTHPNNCCHNVIGRR